MNRAGKWALVALLAAVAASLAGCGQSKIDKAEDEFVSGCHEQGASNSVCSCIFDKLTDRYGKDTIIDMKEIGPSSMPADFGQSMVQAAMQCRSK
jgi:hypothetical protein